MYIGTNWKIRLNRRCVAAMRPYVKLLWPLVIIIIIIIEGPLAVIRTYYSVTLRHAVQSVSQTCDELYGLKRLNGSRAGGTELTCNKRGRYWSTTTRRSIRPFSIFSTFCFRTNAVNPEQVWSSQKLFYNIDHQTSFTALTVTVAHVQERELRQFNGVLVIIFWLGRIWNDTESIADSRSLCGSWVFC